MNTYTVEYKDFNNNPRTEKLYFNLTETEISKMEVDGLTDKLLAMADTKNPKEILDFVDNFILRAYGHKTPDGLRFDKSKESRDNFENSAAFDAIHMDMISDAEKFARFFIATIPESLRPSKNEMDKLIKKSLKEAGVESKDEPIDGEAKIVEMPSTDKTTE